MNENKILAEKTIKALKKNNMNAFYLDKKEEVVPFIEKMLSNGSTVTTGGSMTLAECGVMDLLKSGNYNFLDRSKAEDIKKLYRESFFADFYLCSSNAVTENGELYNADGNSNRVAAICYGPEKIIMVVGINKIVKNLDEAVKRVKVIAAPLNCKRLDCRSYCFSKGKCKGADGEMTDGCSGDSRICCSYLISAHQRIKDRINVIIVGEKLGY